MTGDTSQERPAAPAEPAADAPADAPADTSPKPPPPSRWVIGALVTGLAVPLLCGGVTAVWFSGWETVEDPELIRERAAGVVTAEVPARYRPVQATHIPPPPVLGWFSEDFADGWTEVVEYEIRPPGGDPAARPDPAAPFVPVGQLLFSRLGGTGREVTAAGAAANLEDATIREVAIADGTPVPFAFGTVPAAGGEAGVGMRQVFGVFQAAGATHIVQLTAPAAAYDEAEVLRLLRSVGPPGGGR